MDYNEIILINGEQHKYCKSCTDLLPITKFNINIRNATGYNIRCRTCEIKLRRKKDEERKVPFITPEEILIGMNYNINEDIHLQFCLRHNLSYKPKDN